MSAAVDHRSLSVDGFGAITLAEMDRTVALHTRRDRKYLLSPDVAHQLLEAMRSHARAFDIAGCRSFRYESIYFDTPTMDSYRLTALGRRRRFKVRTRLYTDTGICMLEVKTKGPRGLTRKRRIPYRAADRGRLTRQGSEFVASCLDGRNAEDFAPVLTTSFLRSTLVVSRDTSRMTFDGGLVCTDTIGRAIRVPDRFILETKSNSASTIADRWLWRQKTRPTSISKYCVGCATINPSLPAKKWQRLIDAHTTTVRPS